MRTTYHELRIWFSDGTCRDVTHEHGRRDRYTWQEGFTLREWVAVHPLDQGDRDHEVRRLVRDQDLEKKVVQVQTLRFWRTG